MFLTRKDLRRIRVITGIYIAFGMVFMILWLLSSSMGLYDSRLLVLSLVCPIIGLLSRPLLRKGRISKLNLRGYSLVYQKLRPAEFICLYEEACNDPDNVIAAPNMDILTIVSVAYDSLGMTQNLLRIVEQLYTVAPKKKKPYATLLKTAALYSSGHADEAEQLYREIATQRLNFAAKSLLDTLIKTDRAMALGDYATAEAYYRTASSLQTSPLLKVLRSYQLATICLATERTEEAISHLQYCVEHGGETHYSANAAALLKEVTQ